MQKRNIGGKSMENKTKKEMDEVITELNKFTSRVSTKHDPVDPALIGRFESRFGLKLPEDYKYLLGITNDFAVMGNEVLGMTDESYSYDLFKVYQFEQFWEFLLFRYPCKDERGGFQPDSLLVFQLRIQRVGSP